MTSSIKTSHSSWNYTIFYCDDSSILQHINNIINIVRKGGLWCLFLINGMQNDNNINWYLVFYMVVDHLQFCYHHQVPFSNKQGISSHSIFHQSLKFPCIYIWSVSYVCVHVGGCTCAWACEFEYVCGGQRLMHTVLFNCSLSYCLRQGLLQNLCSPIL